MSIESILVNTTGAATASISNMASVAANALSGGELYESRHRLKRAQGTPELAEAATPERPKRRRAAVPQPGAEDRRHRRPDPP